MSLIILRIPHAGILDMGVAGFLKSAPLKCISGICVGTTGVINKIYALSLAVLLFWELIDKFDLKSGRTTR